MTQRKSNISHWETEFICLGCGRKQTLWTAEAVKYESIRRMLCTKCGVSAKGFARSPSVYVDRSKNNNQ